MIQLNMMLMLLPWVHGWSATDPFCWQQGLLLLKEAAGSS